MKNNFVYILLLNWIGFCSLPEGNAQNLIFKQYIVPMDTAHNHFGKSLDFESNRFIVGSKNGTDENGKNEVSNAGAAYIYTLGGNQWTLEQKIVGPNRAPRDDYSSSVNLKLQELLIGANEKDEYINPNFQLQNVGAVYYYELDTGSWVLKQTLLNSDRKVSDLFGWSMDRLDEDLIVSAIGNDFDANGSDSIRNTGAVYFFRKQSGLWTEVQKIAAPDRNTGGGSFGRSIFLSGSKGFPELFLGSTTFSDALGNNSLTSAGGVYYYRKNGAGSWEFKEKLVASDRAAIDRFGNENQQITYNGNQLFIGSESKTDLNGNNSIDQAGAVYVFEKNAQDKWEEIQKIVSPHRQEFADFGASVSVSDSLLVIGAPGDNTDENNQSFLTDAGALYFYKRDNTGLWKFWRKLVPDNRVDIARFGFKTEVLYNLLITTSFNDRAGTSVLMGSVYYYYIDTNTGIGIYELTSSNDVAIYPNPSTELINFGSPFPLNNVEIYNSQGVVVKNKSLATKHSPSTIDVGELSPGVYFAKITGQGGSSVVKSFVKN